MQTEIAAGSSTVAIDPATTALIVVDIQNDFASEGGMFDRLAVEITPFRCAVRRLGHDEHPKELDQLGPCRHAEYLYQGVGWLT